MKPTSYRAPKTASLIRGIVGHELLRLWPQRHLTITEVKVAEDLRHAWISVSMLNISPDQEAELELELAKVTARLKARVASQLKTKFVPELHLKVDDSARRQARLETLIKAAKKNLAKS